MNRLGLPIIISASLLFAACGGIDDGGAYENDSYYDWGYEPDFYSDQSEEPESMAFRFLPPSASRDYVFVANEAMDTVAKIDADSLAVTSIEVGDRPTQLRALDYRNFAVVLNQDSAELTIIRADYEEGDEISDDLRFVDIDPDVNQLVLSPDGRYAISYFSYAAHQEGEPEGNLQSLSLVRTERGQEAHFSLSCGFQIRSITFRSEGQDEDLVTTHAYIVTDTGVSVIDLADQDKSGVLAVIPVTPYPLDDPLDREVLVTPSGSYAVVRDRARPELYIVRLSDGAISVIELDYAATDIDLFPSDGTPEASEDRAVATIREGGQLVLFDVEAAFDDPSTALLLEDSQAVMGIGSIGPNGRFGIFTTTLGGIKRLAIVDFSEAEPVFRHVDLQKSISGVSIAANGAYALVIHPIEEVAEDASTLESIVASNPGYSLVGLEELFVRLELTEVEPDQLTFWSSLDIGNFAYLSFYDEISGQMSIEEIDLDLFQAHSYSLSSPPTDLGRIAGRGRIFVNQKHEVGRLSFIEVGRDRMQTITGFELNRLTR